MKTSSLFLALIVPVLAAWFGCGGEDQPNASSGQGGQGTSSSSSSSSSTGGLPTLDTSYGEQGVAHANRTYSTDFIFAAAMLPDGSVLHGGSTGGAVDFQPDALLARFTPEGQLDQSYGNDGFVILPLGDNAKITGIAPLPDGSAIVGGTTFRYDRTHAFVAHLDAQGILDPSFGTGGVARMDIKAFERFVVLARADTGEIAVLLAGNAGAELFRLDTKGQVDLSFGTEGHIALNGDSPRDLIYQPDGRLSALVGGSSGNTVYRVTTDGKIDASFGTNGSVAVSFQAYDLEYSSSGELLVAGGDPGGRVLKLDSSGKPDPSFGNGGLVSVSANGAFTLTKWLPNGDILVIDSQVGMLPGTFFRGIRRLGPNGTPVVFNDMPIAQTLAYQASVANVLQKDGHIYLSGMHNGPSMADDHEVMTFVVNDDGSAFGAYGDAGLKQVGSHAAPDVLWDMALRSDGSLIGAGVGGTTPLFVRFAQGKQDAGFGMNGLAAVNFPANGITLDASDRILMTTVGYRVARFLPMGEPDNSFGMQGVSVFMPGNGGVIDIVVDEKQRIVVTGEVVGDGALVARLLEDGSLDPTFGSNGIAIGAAGMKGYVGAVVVDGDGKLVLAGQSSFSDSFVARLLENGSADPLFGANGRIDLGTAIRLFRLEPRKGGGYIAGGSDASCSGGVSCPSMVVAVGADGQLDKSFGVGGIARIEGASFYQAWTGLSELADGSIVVGGAVEQEGTEHLAVWKLKADGTLDTEFGVEGALVLPVKGRATQTIVQGNSLWVGGWSFDPKSGTDMVTLRFGL